MTRRFAIALFVMLIMPLLAAAPGARAQSDQQQVVDEAVDVVHSFYNPGNYTDNVRALVHRSRAIVIVPNLVKAGFIFGAQRRPGRSPDS